ncbi:MAG: hypothetical protein OQK55_00215 [Thermoanaerobaculales bacterium]|nr:hypothetical protein [Thermoanaerobaculales bacterium]
MSQTATCELIYSPSLDDLSDAVTNRMVEGWWPLGRPFWRGEHFIQAMVFEPRFDERNRGNEEN